MSSECSLVLEVPRWMCPTQRFTRGHGRGGIRNVGRATRAVAVRGGCTSHDCTGETLWRGHGSASLTGCARGEEAAHGRRLWAWKGRWREDGSLRIASLAVATHWLQRERPMQDVARRLRPCGGQSAGMRHVEDGRCLRVHIKAREGEPRAESLGESCARAHARVAPGGARIAVAVQPS